MVSLLLEHMDSNDLMVRRQYLYLNCFMLIQSPLQDVQVQLQTSIMSLLSWAALFGQLGLISTLISKGVNVNATHSVISLTKALVSDMNVTCLS